MSSVEDKARGALTKSQSGARKDESVRESREEQRVLRKTHSPYRRRAKAGGGGKPGGGAKAVGGPGLEVGPGLEAGPGMEALELPEEL